jgi:DNA-binding transcriptional regulator YhcF (GntR family)
MLALQYDSEKSTPKYQQVINSIISEIEKGNFKKADRLPAINELCEAYSLSKVTVERAYMHLKKRGYIAHTKGKGYYVEAKEERVKILLVFNKLSYYKKMIYYGLLEVLSSQAKVDLQVHHYDPRILNEIIDEKAGKYDYYVIMPHFLEDTEEEEYLDVIKRIPANKLLLLDKDITGLPNKYMAVFQDFEKDIYGSLQLVYDLLEKYKEIIFIFPGNSNHPVEIIDGAKKFCKEHQVKFTVVDNIGPLTKGAAYITIEEEELGSLIKKIRLAKYKMGKDVGIISFNETVMKELLDITVFTTDFAEMGRVTGQLLLSPEMKKIRNSFSVIRRKSL